jgi:hypothetical protein
LSEGKLGRPVDAYEQVKLAFIGLHLGDNDVEEAYWVALVLLALRLVPFDIRQARDAMSLQAPMKG